MESRSYAATESERPISEVVVVDAPIPRDEEVQVAEQANGTSGPISHHAERPRRPGSELFLIGMFILALVSLELCMSNWNVRLSSCSDCLDNFFGRTSGCCSYEYASDDMLKISLCLQNPQLAMLLCAYSGLQPSSRQPSCFFSSKFYPMRRFTTRRTRMELKSQFYPPLPRLSL